MSHTAPTQHIPAPEGAFKVNLLGEYNIGGDAFVIEDLFERCGITLVSTFCGNSDYASLAQARHADLDLVMCHRSINYVAGMLETAYGIPWLKVNFIGAAQSAKALRKVGKFFGDAALIERIETVIAEEMVAGGEASRPRSARAARARPPCSSSVGRGRTTTSTCSPRSACRPSAPATSSATATTTKGDGCCPTSRSTPTTATSRRSTSNARSTSHKGATRLSTPGSRARPARASPSTRE